MRRTKAKPIPSSNDLPVTSPPKALKLRGKGGLRPKLTAVQLEFCAMVAYGVEVTQASVELGISKWVGYDWANHYPAVRQQIDLYIQKLKADTLVRVGKKIELRTEFLDEQLIRHVRKSKKLDMALAKTFHTGYQRTGAIRPASVSATANAAAAAVAGDPAAALMNAAQAFAHPYRGKLYDEEQKRLKEGMIDAGSEQADGVESGERHAENEP